MRNNRWFMRALMTPAMTLALALSGQAANTGVTNRNVAGPKVSFDKYLVMKQQANVPNATFTFSISHDSTLAHDATDKTPQVYEGIGTPKIGNAVFAPGDTTFTKVQANGNSASVQSVSGPSDDEVTLAAGEKYAKKVVDVDFSSIIYTAPGIYRYTVTETDPSGLQGVDLTDPALDENILYLDVYVNSSQSGELSVAGTVLSRQNDIVQNSIEEQTVYDGGFGTSATAVKPTGFTNHYQTQDLTLEKSVKGNQGDRSRYFPFTVSITNAIPGTVFDVALDDAEPSVQTEGGTKQNPGRLTADDAGSVTAVYYLKDTQSVRIQGIAEHTSYAIKESLADTEGYQVSHQTTTKKDGNEAVAGSPVNGKEIPATEMADMDQDVVYTNYRNGVVPTGVMTQTAPYLMLTVMAALLLSAAAIRREKRKQL